MYTCIYVFLFGYTDFGCSILYESTQYSISEYNYLVNRQLYEKKKKENVELGSYMWGLNYTISLL